MLGEELIPDVAEAPLANTIDLCLSLLGRGIATSRNLTGKVPCNPSGIL
jgi:hypothetical protein